MRSGTGESPLEGSPDPGTENPRTSTRPVCCLQITLQLLYVYPTSRGLGRVITRIVSKLKVPRTLLFYMSKPHNVTVPTNMVDSPSLWWDNHPSPRVGWERK